jgi:periplasmic divalent cation tolerance protein
MLFCTAPREAAAGLGRHLVEQQLAACVNVLPALASIYRWEGAVCEEEESLLVIKTSVEACDALVRELVAAHPYDVPEVIAVPVVTGHEPYLEWVRQSSRAAGG